MYPALEVAKLARDRGAELRYLGSLRGQEGKACAALDIEFLGFPTQPFYGFRTLAGWKALVDFARSRILAKQNLCRSRPDAVFSTGGYAAAPIVSAARALRIPYVIHSADSLPAKSNRMYGREAFAFTCAFRSTSTYVPDLKVTRTGHPIREDLRAAARGKTFSGSGRRVLVVGGSQGSEFLNQNVPAAMAGLDVQVLHATGPKQFQATSATIAKLGLENYELKPYLESSEMARAYAEADVVIARSGGTLAEIAMFGLPSILVPLPTSADDHQLHNAEEFAAMNAATLLRQATGSGNAQVATPDSIRTAVAEWLGDEDRRKEAAKNLHEWDVPDATERIVKLIEAAK
ncbi:MAG: glycosyltransferase [Fimbriimonas sp.]